MAAPPRKFVLCLQFSLRFLLCATTFVALFFALRRGFLMSAFDLSDAIVRAQGIPAILSLAAAVLAALFFRHYAENGLSLLIRGAILGAAIGCVFCVALAIDFGEVTRRWYPEYWNWWQDWPLVAPYLIVATVQGGAIGAFVMQLGGLLRHAFVRRRVKTNPPPHTAKCTTAH